MRYLNHRTYFRNQTYGVFEKFFAQSTPYISRPDIENMSLQMLTSSAQLSQLISDGYDMSSCSFLKTIEKSLKAGVTLFLIFEAKSLVHLSLAAMDDKAYIVDGLFKKFYYNDAGYIGLCYTNPAYRGKGAYPYALSEICRFFKDKGKTRALISAKETNAASISGIVKSGFKDRARVSFLQILFLKFYNIQKINL